MNINLTIMVFSGVMAVGFLIGYLYNHIDNEDSRRRICGALFIIFFAIYCITLGVAN